MLPDLLSFTMVVIALALIFDFINGFHDAANAISTIVATKVLKPWQAVCWSAFFNFIAFFFISTGVAKTVGSGLIDLSFVTTEVIAAGLVAGIAWNLITWWWGMPASSSHTLVGALAGAACGHVLMTTDVNPIGIYYGAAWGKLLAFIFIAPAVGFFLGFIIMRGTRWLQYKYRRRPWNKFYKGAQLASCALLSFNHGGNDAQKTAGVIATAMVAGGYMSQDNFHVPDWALFSAYVAIALGTLMGGWRIVKTLGYKLTKLRPVHGFSAEMGAAGSIALATGLH
ncbi:MAG: anion permease, partial [Alphaproteobacteria bacterium]|nr:anion permease [Alphaproteobacteria bacterium]